MFFITFKVIVWTSSIINSSLSPSSRFIFLTIDVGIRIPQELPHLLIVACGALQDTPYYIDSFYI